MTERDDAGRDGAPLPATVPIFPLPGALLLPRGQLPLHIFEPRYRAMMRDALAGDGVIAMIQPSGQGEDEANPPLFAVGCLGRIAASRLLEDGRYNLVLAGISRFTVRRELPRHADGYRLVEADYSGFETDRTEDRETEIDKPRLLAALRRMLATRSLDLNWEAIEGARTEPLVNALAMGMPFSVSEKQALLESPDVAERARTITALCEMASLAANDDDAPRH